MDEGGFSKTSFPQDTFILVGVHYIDLWYFLLIMKSEDLHIVFFSSNFKVVCYIFTFPVDEFT